MSDRSNDNGQREVGAGAGIKPAGNKSQSGGSKPSQKRGSRARGTHESARRASSKRETVVQPGGSETSKSGSDTTDVAVELALGMARAALEKSAANVEIIDVRGKVDYADVVVVMSGRSQRQVAALARHIEETAKRKFATRCLGVEGLPHGSWVLMDFGDVIVHIFHSDARGYYDLETLWLDAARFEVED